MKHQCFCDYLRDNRMDILGGALAAAGSTATATIFASNSERTDNFINLVFGEESPYAENLKWVLPAFGALLAINSYQDLRKKFSSKTIAEYAKSRSEVYGDLHNHIAQLPDSESHKIIKDIVMQTIREIPQQASDALNRAMNLLPGITPTNATRADGRGSNDRQI
jgi:hypothetical protein